MSKNGVLFDLDGTLVTSFKTDPLPGVITILEELKARNIPLGIATNQAGPLWRAVTGNKKYPAVGTIAENICTIANTLRLKNDLWLVSLWDKRAAEVVEDEEQLQDIVFSLQTDLLDMLIPEIPNITISIEPTFRKPEPGMLLYSCELWGIVPSALVYVGDMESDREAAHRAGAQFVDASNMGKLRDLI